MIRPGCPSASSTTARRSSSTRPTVASPPRSRRPWNGRARRRPPVRPGPGRPGAGSVAWHPVRQLRDAQLRAGYQSYFEITQGPGVAALRSEMIHDARIFPVDEGPHVSKRSRSTTATRGPTGRATRWWWTRPISCPTPFRLTNRLRLHREVPRVADDTVEYHVTWTIPRPGHARGR